MRIKTAILILILIVLALVGLAGRCFFLQYKKSAQFAQSTTRQHQARILQHSRRGMILDRNGHQLAVSNNVDVVFADPELIQDKKHTANILTSILDMPAHEICKKLTKPASRRYSKLKFAISPEEKKKIKQANLSGIAVQSAWKRYWPNGSETAHIVGFTGTEYTGLAGLELKYNDILQGTQGVYTFETDAGRRPIRPANSQSKPGTDGASLVLTIDSTIQSFVYDALMKQYRQYQAESAVAIVMNPQNGEMLAMVSLPDFDPDKFNNTDVNNLKNRAIIDTYEPGSIFKPIATAIGLEIGAVNYNDKIFCENGSYSGKGFGRIGEYGDHRYGNLSISEILIHSSNIGMAKIGQKIGKKRLYEGVRLFGFGKKTGINLPGEDSGLLWPVKNWTGYSITRIPYGQEISVTAIQIARAYCVLANGGKAIRPYVVKALLDSKGQLVELMDTAPPSAHIVKPEVAEWIIQKALAEVVKQGTGKKASLKKWQVFGKTGTANIALPDGKGYDYRNYVASFIGGAPAEKPEIVVLVSIRKPKRSLGKGYTGGTVAAPVVKEIIEKTLTYLERR